MKLEAYIVSEGGGVRNRIAMSWLPMPLSATPEMAAAGWVGINVDGQERYARLLATAPEPTATKEDIDRVAQALFVSSVGDWWEETPALMQNEFRHDARAALAAMGFRLPPFEPAMMDKGQGR